MNWLEIRRTHSRIKGRLLGIPIFSIPRPARDYRRLAEARERLLAGISSQADRRYILEMQFLERGNAYELNLDNPRTLNEKLNWLKLYYHDHPDPLVTQCSDKIGVRDYIASKVGESYLVPCLGVYASPDEIDVDTLPQKFALKVNWGSGQNIICTDKSRFDWTSARRQLAEWMKPAANHYFAGLEWGYRDITPKIIAEQFIESAGALADYKFYCYGGQPKNMVLIENRSLGRDRLTMTYFDADYERLPFEWMSPANPNPPPRPKQWDEMLDISRKLAHPFPYVRVDFYVTIDGRLQVGELTFCPGSGHEPFADVTWDRAFGDLLTLPA